MIGMTNIPVIGYNSQNKTIHNIYKDNKTTVNLIYASAVPISTYTNEYTNDNLLNISNYIMIGELYGSLEIAYNNYTDKLITVFILLLGCGVFNNDVKDFFKNLLISIHLLETKYADSHKKLSIMLLNKDTDKTNLKQYNNNIYLDFYINNNPIKIAKKEKESFDDLFNLKYKEIIKSNKYRDKTIHKCEFNQELQRDYINFSGYPIRKYLTYDLLNDNNDQLIYSDHSPIYYPYLKMIIWNITFQCRPLKDTSKPNHGFIYDGSTEFYVETKELYDKRMIHIYTAISNMFNNNVTNILIQEYYHNTNLKNILNKYKILDKNEFILISKDNTYTKYNLTLPDSKNITNKDKELRKQMSFFTNNKQILSSVHFKSSAKANLNNDTTNIYKLLDKIVNYLKQEKKYESIIFGGDFNRNMIDQNILDNEEVKKLFTINKPMIHTTYNNCGYSLTSGQDYLIKPFNIDFAIEYKLKSIT